MAALEKKKFVFSLFLGDAFVRARLLSCVVLGAVLCAVLCVFSLHTKEFALFCALYIVTCLCCSFRLIQREIAGRVDDAEGQFRS